MSAIEILDELPKLSQTERRAIYQRIAEMEGFESDIEESPEMLAAIDEGRRARENGKAYTPQDARDLIAQWATKSS
jgi:predicted transcriptional regulator